jgi:uncharacterized membrane protein (DUF485 family)
MRLLYRLAIYVMVTVIIEGPSVLILYSYGYPNNPSSTSTLAFLIVYNLYFVLIAFSAIGGPVPNQGPRDMSFDLVYGVAAMFIIVAVVGETIVWLSQEIRKMQSDKGT